MKCLVCDKEMAAKGFGSHLKSHKMSAKEYYDMYIKTPEEGICPVDGKETPFLGLDKGYQKHCNMVCAQSDPEVRAKVNATNLEKYGYINHFQNPEIQAKAEINSHSKEANAKKKATSQLHYGTDNPAQSDEVKAKMRDTCITKYGVDYTLQADEVREKGKVTMEERYGVSYALQNDDIKRKQEQTEREKWIKFAKDNDYLIVQDLLKTYKSGWYQSPLGKEIVFKVGQQDFIKKEDLAKIELYYKCDGSYAEYRVYSWLTTNTSFKIELHNRELIKPKEIDIYIPELKLGIECNGYYHTDECYVHRDQYEYHIQKYLKSKENGIELIFVSEDDLEEKLEFLNRTIRNI